MADSEVHLLVLTKKDLHLIIEEYEEFGIELRQIATERRKYH